MSDSEEESYAAFGIPLEPLDEENLPRKKAVTIEDQYAYDAQGRRRFHGAFTGGFSAGYFNTVGTRDGWKPQQFKSSKGSKAKVIEQQPEDFMDEEDVSIFGIAPKGIRANSDYEYHGQKGTKRGRIESINNQSLTHNPVLKELLRPVRETVGIVLLKKMGWKPGQGVGNRVTKREKIKAKKQIEKVKVYGLLSSTDKEADSNIDDSDEDTANITFAPDDCDPFWFRGKDNYFGIGYSGLNRQNILSNQIDTKYNFQSSYKSLPIFGHGFGVGAFEVDDDDIYEREDMSQYDCVLGPEHKSKTRWSADNILSNNESNNCIDGFVQAIDKLNYKKTFAPPNLPKDYCHLVHLRKGRFYPPIQRETVTEKGKILNIADRCRILSDIDISDKMAQQLLDKNKKVLSSNISTSASKLMSESVNSLEHQNAKDDKDLEKLKAQTNTSWMSKLSAKEFVSGGATETVRITPGLLSKSKNVSNSSIQINKISFSTDLDKQKQSEFSLTPSKANEKHKLEKMQLVKPAESDDANINRLDDYPIKIIDCLEKGIKETTKIEMFGKLTREINEWQPASIVCKRFNVPEPENSYTKIKLEKKFMFSVFDSLNLNMLPRFSKGTNIISKDIENEACTSYRDESIKNNASILTHFDIFNNEMQIIPEKVKKFEASYEKIFGKTVYDKSEEIREKKLEDNKTKMVCRKNSEEKRDLYRAIFLSSSEESETEVEVDMDNEAVKSALIGDSLNDTNIARNISPPRGIFAKLDLDNLVIKPKSVDTRSIVEKIEHNKQTNLLFQPEPQTIIEKNLESEITNTLQTAILPEVYGPILPLKLMKDDNAANNHSESTEFSRPIYKSVVIPKVAENTQGQWVEIYRKKKSKKIKKKHKHKEHKSLKNRRKSKRRKH